MKHFQVCIPLEISNCKEIEDWDTCRECNEGYYLDSNNNCTEYPLEIIKNC